MKQHQKDEAMIVLDLARIAAVFSIFHSVPLVRAITFSLAGLLRSCEVCHIGLEYAHNQ
ncbi:MAG: hypothetical protein HOO95_08950 [Gallionella sp.]|nr:hypothetical protein [Gallionella sp.]